MIKKTVTKMKNQWGYTLTELIITIGIIGIAAGVAAPALNDFIKNNRMTNAANKVVSAINLARSEAVSRRLPTTITGDDTSWEVKYIPAGTTVGVTIINYTLDAGMEMEPDDNSFTGLRFTPDGFRDMAGDTSPMYFEICSSKTDNTRRVNVNAAGTTSVEKRTDGCTFTIRGIN